MCGSSGRFIFIARGYLFISLTAGPIYGMTAFTVRVIKLFGLGVKTLEKLEKYTVDVLGEHHKVGKEVRQPFNIKRRKACPSEML